MMAQPPVCWRIEHPASDSLSGRTHVDLCVAGVLWAWVARLDELLQHPQHKQWQRQPEPPRAAGMKPPRLAALPCAWWADQSPDLCIPVRGLRQQRCSICIFFGGLPDTFSLQLTGLPCLTVHSSLFYPFCPGTLGKPCGAVKCLGEMLSIGTSMCSCWS